MLEPISLGQGRTHCPGLAADERGVVMGRRLALFFPDVARAVGFFRSLSRETSLDDILASLNIQEATSERGGSEVMVSFEVTGSFAADRAAQAGRQHRGRPFTGTERHFVPYRDRRSPLGYDLGSAEELVAEPLDFTLYGDAGPDRRKLGRSIRLVDLVIGLTPRPLTGVEKEREQVDSLVVRCEHGLASALCRYLWGRQIKASVRTALSAHKSAFSGRQREIQLVRTDGMPRHVANLLSQTPGMRVFVPVQPQLLVEWGYRHPIALESCGAAFSGEETVLFFGPPAKVERLSVAEDGVDIADLVDIELHGKDGVIPPPMPAPVQGIEVLDVQLRLTRVPVGASPTTALLIDRARMPWFQKLVYALPAAVLKSYEAAVCGDRIIVVNRRGVHGIPFGAPMTEAYPQVFVPVGMSLLPRVDYDLLREHLQIEPARQLYFFPEDQDPFSIAVDQLKPLARAVVANARARESILELDAEPLVQAAHAPSVVHRRQGVFSLWRGTKVVREQPQALAPPPERSSLLAPANDAPAKKGG